jgi:hypothetical protein
MEQNRYPVGINVLLTKIFPAKIGINHLLIPVVTGFPRFSNETFDGHCVFYYTFAPSCH